MRMQVKLEIGHKAACRESPTSEGFTHDWTVFVRGSEGKDISHFVEKVVFHLHESFPKSKRAVKEPPYKVDECGYGSFELKIEVCFKTKDEPRRVTFTYDLFLPLLGYPPVSNVRTEALTFTHPTEDFMKKLIKGGGIQISSANGVSGTSLSNGHGNILKDETKETVQKSASISDTDKGKKMKVPKAASKPTAMVGMKRSPPSNENSATDGPSVKKKKKKKKSSEGTSSSSKSKQPVLEQNAANTPTSLPVAADVKDLKVKFKSVPTKEGEKRKEHHSTDSHQKPKVSSHGSHSSHASHTSKGKEMKGHSEHALSSESKPKGDSNDHKTKEKRKAEKLKKKSTSDKKEKKEKKGKKTVEKVTIRRNSGDSWASSGSSCGLMSNVVNKNKALGKLLSEMSDAEDEDLGENLPTPFKREPSPALPKAVVKEQCTGDLEKTSDPNTSKHKAKENKPRISASIIDNSGVDCVMNGTGETLASEVGETKKSTTYAKNSSPRRNEEKNGLHKLSRKELFDLYDFITNCRDSSSLQKVVDVIETTGLYTVAEKTFEFDLCCLEKTTLRKIQKCLGLR